MCVWVLMEVCFGLSGLRTTKTPQHPPLFNHLKLPVSFCRDTICVPFTFRTFIADESLQTDIKIVIISDNTNLLW